MNNERLYSEIVNNMSEGVYFVNKEKRIILWNSAAESITGYKGEEMLGRTCQDTGLRHIDGAGQLICIMGCPLHHTLFDGQKRTHQVFVKHKNGYRLPLSVSIFPIVEGESILGAIEIFMVNSPTVYGDELIESLSSSAMNDTLTGLPNRRKIESFLQYRISELKMFQNTFCLLLLDIDNFRNFNNTYGHDVGDEVLKSASKSVMGMIRRTDIFGRWGGEEFIGIFAIKENNDALLIADKIRVLIEKTEILHNDAKLSITASVGVTVARGDDTIESVTKRADELMYQSKQNGKNQVTSDVIE